MKTTATIILDYSNSGYETFTKDLDAITRLGLEYGLWMPGYPDPDGDSSIRRISDGDDYYPCMVFSMNAEDDEQPDNIYARFLSLLSELGLERIMNPDSHSAVICRIDNLNDWVQDYAYSDLDLVEKALGKEPELFRTPWLIEKYIEENICDKEEKE